MALTEVAIPQNLIDDLSKSFRQGPMLDAGGRRMLPEEAVAKINGMSIVIQALEHPPPHFHVRFAGSNASFSIEDGSRLPNVKGLEKYERNIRKWWSENRCALIETWNRTRPDNCPVGPMAVPPDCLPNTEKPDRG
ncbi:DUF4160 domain-containing protein [Parvibaculum sedimenti]|nr:DUF4160 domain-containing protein [Parvibaculum sedimenti]